MIIVARLNAGRKSLVAPETKKGRSVFCGF